MILNRDTAQVGPKVAVTDKLELPGTSPFYSTELGSAFLGDSLSLLRATPDNSVDLVVTSPPYALEFKKAYGNVSKEEYVNWIRDFAIEVLRVLKESGSFVLNIGGSWLPKSPTRSLYHFRVLLMLVEELGFHLAQELFWYNPAKMPAPAEWVTVQRIRVKDSVEYCWWFSKTSRPKANNRNVLVPYSPDMERLIKKGYRAKERPSGHVVTDKWGRDQGGAIPGNVLIFGNNDSNGDYIKNCEAAGVKPHPARFPPSLPEFFIALLTDPGDLVVDIFAGSNTTGMVAERMGRRWAAFELREDYMEASRFRFTTTGRAPEKKARKKPKDNQGKLDI